MPAIATHSFADFISHKKSTLYLTGCSTEVIPVSPNRIKLITSTDDDGGQNERSVGLDSIRRVVVIGVPRFSTEVLYRFIAKAIPVDFIDLFGKPRGQLLPDSNARSNLELMQLNLAQSEKGLQLMKQLVLCKLDNCFSVIERRFNVKAPALIRDRIKSCQSKQELRGVEGIAARHYFNLWHGKTGKFEWLGRRSHPSPDPLNLLLSTGYNLLYNRFNSALKNIGLNSALGFFHVSRGYYCALSCDLMEPLRAIVDSVVLTLIRLGKLSPDDFTFKNGQCSFKDHDALKIFFGDLENKFAINARFYSYDNGMEIQQMRCVNDLIDDYAADFLNSLCCRTNMHVWRIRPCNTI